VSASVVCVGLATRDTILAVPRHPGADDRVVASALVVAGGGPAATAAVTLARLGVPVAFVGRVGDDDAGAVIRDGLEREGVGVSELAVVPGGRSPESSILVGGGGRTIVAYLGDLPPLELGPRARELCQGAQWVHADETGYAAAATLRGKGRLSVDGGNPIGGPDLDLRGVALYAPTEAALAEQLGSPEQALRAGAEAVVVTRGERGSTWYGADGTFDAPGVAVAAVSTLGAGDVFHGALLAALLRGLAPPEALGLANRVAALSCRALDGRSAIPTAQEVER
jgi:sugar/nucleoside kinase (ribokinase family)